jgi:putative hydrolases of HD superfamily
MNEERLERQLAFIMEIDRLKSVLRQTLTDGGRRQENTAEHSWHVATMAVLLAEHAEVPVDAGRVIRMLLVHDIVEVDAGDTFCYDAAANLDKAAREQAAAERLFGLLPPEQGCELRELWEEFEAYRTPDARFANALDRLQAMMLNYHAQGRPWRQHGITSDRVLARNEPIGLGSARLWEHARKLVDDALANGYLDS